MSAAPSGSPRERLISAMIVALVSFAYAGARAWHEPAWPTDFDQLWHAARGFVHGADPYTVVGPGRRFEWLWPLYYPMPAVVFSVPLTLVPVAVARVLFSGFAGALLGFSLGARLRYLWPMLLSASFLIATSRTQWAPAILAVAWLPWAGAVVSAKPNIGLALLAALRGRALLYALSSAAFITLISFALRPDWFSSWRAAIADSPHVVAPILMPGGFLILLAFLRWRREDARLLLALSLIPHTPSLYDLLPLFFLCRTRLEALTLAALTQALFWGFISFSGGPTFDTYAAALGRVSIFVVYLPAVAALLLRPNSSAQDESVSVSSARLRGPSRIAKPLELSLVGGLSIAAALLIWLPLVTRR